MKVNFVFFVVVIMYAYVKNLTAGIKNPFSICHTSRIFDYVSENRRRKFDPKKYDVNTSYGIVISSNLVKHQVILVKGKFCIFVTFLIDEMEST